MSVLQLSDVDFEGIRAVNFYGGFHMANTTDVELGNMDSDKTVAVEIKHDDKIKEDELAYVQVCMLMI